MNIYGKIVASLIASLAICSANAQGFGEDLDLIYGGEEFVSIATGQKQLVSKAPAVATVITAEDIKAIGARDLDEILQTVPGLHVGRDEFYNPIYTIRGVYSKFNAQVLVLVNGISITNLYLGNRGLIRAGMPVESIARIEVIRGPGSAIYGADAFSGVVNIITKTQGDIQGTKAGVRAGSFNTNDIWLTHGGKLGDFDFSFTLEYGGTDGHEEIVDSDLQTVLDGLDSTNVTLAPGPVSLTQDYLDLRFDMSKNNWRIRAGIQERENLGVGAGVGEALDPSGKFAGTRRNLDITYHNPNLTNGWDITSQLSYFHTTQEIDSFLILFPPGSKLGLGSGTPPFTNGVIGNPEVFEDHWRFEASAFYRAFENHTLRFNLGFHLADIFKVKESKNFGLNSKGQPITPGDPLDVVDDTPFIFLPEDHRRNKHFVFQDVWSFATDWELTAGVRYDDYSDFGDTTNPRLALVWSTSHNLTTKLLYGRAFRAPAFVDTRNQNNPVAIGNPDLDPETIETSEIAFDYRFNFDARIGLNIFKYRWDDIIDFISDPPPETTKTAQNEGSQKGQGFELEVEWNPSSEFSLLGNYSYQDSEDRNTNSTVARVPEQLTYLRTNWSISSAWNLISQVNWVSGRERALGDTRPKVDDYTVFDVALAYDSSSSNWGVKLMMKNAFDEEAREPSSSFILNDFPQAGTNYFLELRYSF